MKTGRPKRFSEGQIRDALRLAGGVLSVAAQLLTCDRKTVSRAVAQNAALQAEREEAGEVALDLAELNLFNALKRGEPWATRYMLSAKGRKRGYGAGAVGGGGQLVIHLPPWAENL